MTGFPVLRPFKEKRTGLIYEEDILEEALNTKIINKYSTKDSKLFRGKNSDFFEELVKNRRGQYFIYR